MTRHRYSVEALAREAEMELDEVLVTLWDVGITEVNDPVDVVPRRQVSLARKSLLLPAPNELISLDYWKAISGLSDTEFNDTLNKLGLAVSASSRRLPKGGVRKLRSHFLRMLQEAVEPTSASVSDQVWEPLAWVSVGHERALRYLTADQIYDIPCALMVDVIQDRDPIDSGGIRDKNLLASAASRLLTANGDDVKYPTVEMAAAALLHSLVLNHPFVDGNKRTGLVSFLVFLDENGIMLTCEEDDLFRFVLLLAQHRLVDRNAPDLSDREVMMIATWVRDRSRNVVKGEKIIKWHRLRRILSRYDCELDHKQTAGSRINISRPIETVSRFRKRAIIQTVSIQVHYKGEGSDVQKDTLAKVRHKLELDDEHGIDSASFYSDAEAARGEFITVYRKTLRRLSRL